MMVPFVNESDALYYRSYGILKSVIIPPFRCLITKHARILVASNFLRPNIEYFFKNPIKYILLMSAVSATHMRVLPCLELNILCIIAAILAKVNSQSPSWPKPTKEKGCDTITSIDYQDRLIPTNFSSIRSR